MLTHHALALLKRRTGLPTDDETGSSAVGFMTLAPQTYDRFALWPAPRARAALLAILALLIASALVPIRVGKGEIARPPAMIQALTVTNNTAHAHTSRPRDDDLKLYDIAIARIARGENYYDFIVAEQRHAHYPVHPGFAVRLPTLAYLDAWAGVKGDSFAPLAMAAAMALMLATVWAWWRKLGEEPCSDSQRRVGTALLFLGASLGLNRYFFVLHELWAGMLIALAFGLHRPEREKWHGAWLAAALALAIRELTLPFVALLAAQALLRRRTASASRRAAATHEAIAWITLIALFGIGLALHLHRIAIQVRPNDPVGPSWFALRGLGGFLSNVTLSSNLRFFPHEFAGPLVILMLIGWAGWDSSTGVFGTALYMGYAFSFMIAGRNDNYYWGAMIAPAMFLGLVFAPMALLSLVRQSLPRSCMAHPLATMLRDPG